MPIRSNGGSEYIQATGLPALNFPCWARVVFRGISGAPNRAWIELYSPSGNSALSVRMLANYNWQLTSWTNAWGTAGPQFAGPAIGSSQLDAMLLVWTSASSVTLYWNGGSYTADIGNGAAGNLVDFTTATLNSAASASTDAYAEFFAGTGTPDATQRAALLDKTRPVETIAGLTTLWGWDLNPSGAAGASAGATLPPKVGSVSMTNSGMVIAADTHPVTRPAAGVTQTKIAAAPRQTYSWYHTVAPGSNRVLIVDAVCHHFGGSRSVSSLKCNGTAMTFIGRRQGFKFSADWCVELWYMPNPPVGTVLIEVDWGADVNTGAGGASRSRNDILALVNNYNQQAGPASSYTYSVTDANTNAYLICGMNADFGAGYTMGANTTLVADIGESAGLLIESTALTSASTKALTINGVPSGETIGFVFAEFTANPPSGPTLTSPSGTGGALSATGSVTTDNATGTLWFKADASATATDPGAGSEAGAGWLSQAVSATGVQAVNFGALTAGTKYGHFLHVNATGGRSSVVNTASFTVSNSAATAVTLTGPSGGVNGVASTNFTVGANGAITGSIVVTPSAGGGGGTFSPTSVTLTSGSPTATFTYTPASTGVKSISVTNGSGLTNPAAVDYTVTAAPATALPLSSPELAGLSGFSGVVLSAPAPGTGVTVIKTFTGLSFSGGGAASIDIASLGVLQAQVRYVIGSQSDGSLAPGTNPRCFQGPIAAI